MKKSSLIAGVILVLFVVCPALAQEGAPAASPSSAPAASVGSDLKDLVTRITTKLRAGERSAAQLEPELAEFDALLVKYPERNDDTAQIAMMKAVLYLQVFEDEAKGRELLSALKTDFPGTKAAANVDRVFAQMEQAKAAKAASAALVGKPAPELHFKWSSMEGVKTLSDLKGKVVVLDFWATWCGPCIASFPQLREHVEQFKNAPVAFLGVTSIQGFVANMGERIDTKGDPDKEMALMPDFMKSKEMTWDVVFSEEQVFNPDYGIQGIPHLAIIAPDGTVRHSGLHPGDKAADVPGKIQALLKEFNLSAPATKS
jgi:thiol-disulfide isomerase/thioredoxin